MSLEHSPARDTGAKEGSSDDDLKYWHALIDEKAAAAFLGVTPRTMQKNRQTGGGCRYVLLSSRCVRYTRGWLREHAMARMRTSTADPGPEEATA